MAQRIPQELIEEIVDLVVGPKFEDLSLSVHPRPQVPPSLVAELLDALMSLDPRPFQVGVLFAKATSSRWTWGNTYPEGRELRDRIDSATARLDELFQAE